MTLQTTQENENEGPTNGLQKLAFTVDESCFVANTSRTQIYNFIRDGRLVAHKLNGKTLILRDNLMRLLNTLPTLQSQAQKEV